MHKNNLLLLCFCIAISLFAVHWIKSVKTPLIPIKKSAIQQSAHAITKDTSRAALMPSDTIAAVKPNAAKVSAGTNAEVAETTNGTDEREKEIAAQEKYMLLGKLREWAAKNPEEALAAAMKLPAGDERNQALTAVCFGLAQTDPADAVKTAESLQLDSQPGDIVGNLVQQWAAADLTSALDWAVGQPPGDQRNGFIQRVAYNMSRGDPADAAELVVKQIPAGPAQNEAIITVLNQWANQDLVAAAIWVKGLPAGPLQERAVNELAGIQNRQQALAHQ